MKKNKVIINWKSICFVLIVFLVCQLVGIVVNTGKISSLEGYMYSLANEIPGATSGDATSSNATSCNATSSNATSCNATSCNATSGNAAGGSIINPKIISKFSENENKNLDENNEEESKLPINETVSDGVSEKEINIENNKEVSFLESNMVYIIIIAVSIIIVVGVGLIIVLTKKH